MGVKVALSVQDLAGISVWIQDRLWMRFWFLVRIWIVGQELGGNDVRPGNETQGCPT